MNLNNVSAWRKMVGTRIVQRKLDRSKNPKCPNCNKRLWTVQHGERKGELHCPKGLKGGCGYVLKRKWNG